MRTSGQPGSSIADCPGDRRALVRWTWPGRRLGVLVLFACAAVFSGCAGRPAGGEKLERLTIAFQRWVGYGPLYLAAEKGFFAAQGLELVFVDERLDAARRDAFKAGMLDAEAGTIDLLVSKRAVDTPVVAVAEIDLSLGGDAIVAAESIQRLADLVGKKVAFARDDVGETFLSFLLHKAGLSLDQITIVPTATDKAGQAFLDGKADAAVTWEPWVSKALVRPGAHVLLSSKDEPGIIVDILSVREDVLREKPGTVRALLRGWYQAVEYYRTHPEEGSRIIAPHYQLTPKQYRQAVKGLYWPTHKEARDHFGTKENPGRLHKLFETISLIKHKDGRIPSRPEAAQALNADLLRALDDNGGATR